MSVMFCQVCQESEGQEIQFAAEVCPHLLEQLKEGKPLSEAQFVIIKVEIDLFGKNIVYYWFCHYCVSQYHLPTDGKVLSKEEVDNEYKEAFDELKLYCINCLEKRIVCRS